MDQTFANMSSSYEDTFNHTDFALAIDSPSLPLWSVITHLSIVSTLTVISIAGNGLIVTVEYYTKNKTSTDWLVTFMAATDLVTCVIDIATAIMYFSGLASSVICGILTYLSVFTKYTSSWLLTTICIERYFKTCRPRSTTFAPKWTLNVCIGVILVSCVVSVPAIPLSIVQEETITCRMITISGAAKNMFLVVIVSSFAVMFCVIIVMYTKIAFAMRKRITSVHVIHVEAAGSARTANTLEMRDQSQRSNTMDRNRSTRRNSTEEVEHVNIQNGNLLKHTNRITFIMGLLTTVFIITWLPVFVVGPLFANRQVLSIKETVVFMFVRILPLMNTITNPIFYVLMSSKFRQKSKVVLLKRYQAMRNLCCH